MKNSCLMERSEYRSFTNLNYSRLLVSASSRIEKLENIFSSSHVWNFCCNKTLFLFYHGVWIFIALNWWHFARAMDVCHIGRCSPIHILKLSPRISKNQNNWYKHTHRHTPINRESIISQLRPLSRRISSSIFWKTSSLRSHLYYYPLTLVHEIKVYILKTILVLALVITWFDYALLGGVMILVNVPEPFFFYSPSHAPTSFEELFFRARSSFCERRDRKNNYFY